MGIPMGNPWKWEHKTIYAKNGNGMGRVHLTMGMGMTTFSYVPQIPIGRLDVNRIQ